MAKFQKKYVSLISKWVSPIFDPCIALFAIPRYFRFFNDMRKYSKMKGAEAIRLSDISPCIHEKTETTHFDIYYFYQDIWAFQRILENKPNSHVDVGSKVYSVGFFSTVSEVKFIDLRPIKVNLDRFESIKGDILALPFEDSSIKSLSCLSVAEHIGLGRYGDSLDPFGTKKACRELTRVLAKDGNLYFAVPIGKPRLCFNSHRIHSPKQIIEYFRDLKLVEFSAIDEKGNFIRKANLDSFRNSDFSCGLFWFRK